MMSGEFKLGKIDLSQIECRILNTLAGQWDVAEKFRNGVDLYSDLASQFYGFAVDKSKPAERGTGKQLELSCFSASTPVLTNHGPKPIADIQLDDLLWDGIEWVTHQGLLAQGIRTVTQRAGLWATPDHLVWCGDRWRHWGDLDASTTSEALVTARASSPLPAIELGRAVASFVTSSNAHVDDQNMSLTPTTCTKERQRGVQIVHTLQGAKRVKSGMDMLISAPMLRIEGVCLHALPQLLRAAKNIIAMEDEEFECILPGRWALSDAVPSSPIWLRCRAGIGKNWSSIVSTIIKVMHRAICALPHATQTRTIAVLHGKKTLVYDLSCAGPRNRFTVLSKQGPLIVHNCGYGAGGPTIVRTARAGTYGPPVYLTDAQGLQARDLYRGTHPFVVALWERASQILYSLHAGHTMEWGPPGQGDVPCMTIHDHRIFGPGGLWLDYSSLKREQIETQRGVEEVWMHRVREGWRKTYGARLIENVVQWLASYPIRQSIVQLIEMGYRVPLTVHDDIFALIPANGGGMTSQEHLVRCAAVVGQTLPWMPACPIAVEAELLEALDK